MTGDFLATALFLVFQICGVLVSLHVFCRESAGAKLLLGSVLGSVMLQWLPVPFAFFLGFSIYAHLCALVTALLCAGLCAFKGLSGLHLPRSKFWLLPFATTVFFAILVWRSFLFKDDRIYSSQATYGDMAMHLSFITGMARQGIFPPEYTLLPGTLLCYPFLSDSISASLYLLGGSLKLAYSLPMVFAGAQVFFGFSLLAKRFLGSFKKSAIAFLLFFLNGGLGFFWFLGSKENFTRIFTAYYETPTNYTTGGLRWVNVIVDMLLPQRATLFGWAVLFAALYLLYAAAFEREKRYFLYTGVLAGLLPMIHTHSFLGLGLAAAGWMLGTNLKDLGCKAAKLLILLSLPVMSLLQLILRKTGKLNADGLLVFAIAALVVFALITVFCARKSWRDWGVLLLTTLILAVPQLLFWTFRQSGGFVHGHFGWVAGEDNYLWFWIKNMGLTFILSFAALLLARREKFVKYLPALPIWFAAEFIQFQPNEYDNNKLLYVAFVFLTFAAADLLGEFATKKVFPMLAAAAILLFTSASAVLTLGRECVSQYELFGEGAMNLTQYVEEHTPPRSVILTDTRHNNEIASLSGRSVVCGSPIYLYFHGLPYYQNEAAAQQMYEDPAGNRLLFDYFNVDYILISDFERNSYQIDEQGLYAMGAVVYDDGSRTLIKVER